MITSGNLFQKIQFYSLVTVPDFAGGTKGSYTLALATRAQVVPMNGRRLLENGQREEIRTLQFNIRWRKDMPITSGLLLVYRGLPYTIFSIVDVADARQEFAILARAKEGITSIPLTIGGVMEFKNNFKTNFG